MCIMSYFNSRGFRPWKIKVLKSCRIVFESKLQTLKVTGKSNFVGRIVDAEIRNLFTSEFALNDLMRKY